MVLTSALSKTFRKRSTHIPDPEIGLGPLPDDSDDAAAATSGDPIPSSPTVAPCSDSVNHTDYSSLKTFDNVFLIDDSSSMSDRSWLPISIMETARMMKAALPDNAKIAKEARECMQESVSEFISFITREGMYPLFISCDGRPCFGPALTSF